MDDLTTLSFSQRLKASKCSHCGPGMGLFARDVPVLGNDGKQGVALVICRWCGGHSSAFREENYP